MNPISLRRLLFLLASVAAFALTGCDSIRPIASKPPLAKIDLAQSFTTSWKNSVVPLVKYSVILPSGEYHPAFEDDKFYYYQAPTRVIYKDLNSSLLDGGIRLARGATIPRGWYCVSEDGTMFTGEFKAPLPVQ
jgi:hypothetical protein